MNNLKISKTGLAISESQEKQAEADICLAVMEAYYNVVYNKRLADIYEEQVSAAELALTKAVKQEEIGQKGHADVVQMEADLADRKYDLITVRNSYKDQLTTLSDLMFWPEDEELVIETSISSPAYGEDSATIMDEREESIVSYALENNPQVKIAQWQAQNARRELNTTKWQLLPSVGMYAGWNTSLYSIQGAQSKSFSDQFRNRVMLGSARTASSFLSSS